MDDKTALLRRPASYVCPLSQPARDALEQLVSMEQTQLYNVQQCGLCGLTLDQYRQRSEQRLALAQLILQHFPPDV